MQKKFAKLFSSLVEPINYYNSLQSKFSTVGLNKFSIFFIIIDDAFSSLSLKFLIIVQIMITDVLSPRLFSALVAQLDQLASFELNSFLFSTSVMCHVP